jgi:NADPH-dependent 2,4-dienoyl-CoA reductase/sulfur reductase-like enzyme
MSKEIRQQFDVLVIGGGPAGMAAAVSAAECGPRVGLVDDNPSLGGQIWRGETANRTSEGGKWAEKLRARDVEVICGARVFHQPEVGTLLAEGAENCYELGFQKLVLATGARERFLPFPGWTLPNVMGAGGLQALVKSGLPIAGKRVVVAGSGPLLLAVAAYLHEHGARIPIICEQASWTCLLPFGVALLRHPQKIAQGFSLGRKLAGVRFVTSCWPVAAEGEETLKAVIVSRGNKREQITCDYLACGFHLVPNVELATLLGCRIQDGYVKVDDFQETSVSGIFCAGEPTGIGGLELSLIEGRIAGLAAAGRSESANQFCKPRAKLQKFAQALDRAFSPHSELKSLALPDTIVCRCEDVKYDRLKPYTSWRAAKLHTRCGMGVCQGRVCGPATQFLLNWQPDSVRPPIFPTRCENLAAMTCSPDGKHSEVTGGHG